MNNLLKSIRGSPFKATLPETDLKLLLSSVRDIRSQDTKAADSFYYSLEGVLQELRTVTTDNRDAEAFLKPVSRTEYPDYYEVIKHPMDLGTMLKNVKNRKYKSKHEFAADLTLIWKNCFKYNSGPEHVLRGCVTRLKRKADHLLTHVSDRPDRITINGIPTPSASNSSPSPFKPVKVNGNVNGVVFHDRVPTPDPLTPRPSATPTPGPSTSHSQSKSPGSLRPSPAKLPPSNGVPFEDQPALIRTPASMSTFSDLDRELQRALDGVSEEIGLFPPMSFDSKGKGKETVLQRLRSLADDSMDVSEDHSPADDGAVANRHLKRKWPSTAQDQRKRPRLLESLAALEPAHPEVETEEDLLQAWWEATPSHSLLVGGLPSVPQFNDSNKGAKPKLGKRPRLTTTSSLVIRGSRKKAKRKRVSARKPAKSLLTLMNNNIATLMRVRRTHAKFVALNAASDSNNPAFPAPDTTSEPEPDGQEMSNDGWLVRGEVSEEVADDCLSWMGSKVLQHAGFQGSSQMTLSVLTSVAAEYLQNVGRTIRFLCDKYSNTMSAEDIILHTLFESGTTEIQDLERYIKDDVIRYGGRLGDLEKKLVGAYREVTSVEVPSEEGMFEDADDGDHFATGMFSGILGEGEDFLGLRELGIEAEFGLKSLSIPKRLWKGRSGAEDSAAIDRTKTGEPPSPFPPPPPFVPLESSKADSQIGLLKKFYQDRFSALSSSSAPEEPGANGVPATPANAGASLLTPSPAPLPPQSTATSTTPLSLPDDPPNPTRAKIGPLGQVIVTNPSTTANKKRGGKAKEPAADKGKDKDAEATASPKKEAKKVNKDVNHNNQGDGQIPGADANGAGPKKKPKGPKKAPKNAKPILEAPPVIAAPV